MNFKEKEAYLCPRTFIGLQKICYSKNIFLQLYSIYVIVYSSTHCCVLSMTAAVAEAAVGRCSSSRYPAVVKKLMSDISLKKI